MSTDKKVDKAIISLVENQDILTALATLFKNCRISDLNSDDVDDSVGRLKGIGILMELIVKDLALVQEVLEDMAAKA